jgi:hydrogenase/urease accessory protein HupE
VPVFPRICSLLALLAVLLIAGSMPAQAHVRDTTGYSTVEGDGRNVSYTLSLEYEMLARTVDLGPDALAAEDDAQRLAALEAGQANLADYLDGRVQVFLDGAGCEPTLNRVATEIREEKPYALMELAYACPGASGSYELRYDVFSARDAVAEGHTNIVDYRLAGQSGRTVMDGATKEVTVGEGSALAANARFGLMGIEHILLGLDHVLFVIALMLGAKNAGNLLRVISMFTLAHSITLIAALVGWVSVPAAIVEPLIALSIAFVAIENLTGATRTRLPVVFLFGLLHGLGFAGSLNVTDEVSWPLVLSLLSFNVGIELGQALLLVAVFPLLLLVRRFSWSKYAARGATAVVAAFGLFWFVERFFLA